MKKDNWEDRFDKYKMEITVVSKPSNYLHVGLDEKEFFSHLIKDISTLLEEERGKVIEEVEKIVKHGKNPYMLPETEKRFLNDLTQLKEKL